MKPIQVNITANYKTRNKGRNRLGRNSDGWIALVKLPLGLGMTLGSGMSGWVNVRSWEWSQFDYADHSPTNAPRWSQRIMTHCPTPSTRLGQTLEAWRAKRWG